MPPKPKPKPEPPDEEKPKRPAPDNGWTRGKPVRRMVRGILRRR